jgi:hypothetical protein
MPSHLHEILIEMFRDRPTLAAELLRGPLHVPVPDFDDARMSPSDLTDFAPTEYRADAVVTLVDGDVAVLAVVIEVQLRLDIRKRRSWPAYVATLYARLACPVALLVVCPAQAVADWSAAPIVFGPPGSVLTPLAIGPAQIPVITDRDTAQRIPELAVLSALAHGTSPDPAPVFGALLTALSVVDRDHASLYTDLILSVLPAAARVSLEEFMVIADYEFQSDFYRRRIRAAAAEAQARGEAEGRAQGEAEGRARAVLAVLDARGIDVPDDVREEIANCTDLDRLDRWIRQAVTADAVVALDGLATTR